MKTSATTCRPLASINGVPSQTPPCKSPQLYVAAKIGPEISMPMLCAMPQTAFSDATGISWKRDIMAHRKETRSEEPSAETATPATMTIGFGANPTAVIPTMIKMQLPMESNRSFRAVVMPSLR